MSTAVSPQGPRARAVRASPEERAKFEGTYACILAYNDEASIAGVVLQALGHCGKVIVCDDGSTDGTAVEARRAGAQVIRHETILGKGRSTSDLVNEVILRSPTGFVLVEREGFVHADEVGVLLEVIMKDEADIAVGMSGTVGIGAVDAGVTAMNPKALFALTREGFFSDAGASPQTALAAVAGLRVRAVTLRTLEARLAAPRGEGIPSSKPAGGGSRLSRLILERDFLAMGVPALAFTLAGVWLLAAFLISFYYTKQITVTQGVRGVIGLTSIIFGMAFMVSYIVTYSVRHASRERKE